jgi:hypothetical protein
MKRRALWLAGGGALAAAAMWQAVAQNANETSASDAGEAVAANASEPANAPATPQARAPTAPPQPAFTGKTTPMAERVATLGILNKRNGLYRDLRMKPGQAVRIGDLVVRLKACETTAPWEPEAYTGAFVQVIVNGSDEKWRKVFSGWLYKESPSLNVVEHPIYDVWTKACAMKHPDTGPETIVVRGNEGSRTPSSRSSAPKSPAPAPSTPPESAAESNTI